MDPGIGRRRDHLNGECRHGRRQGRLLREAGYKAEIKKDKQGEGYIESGANGGVFQVIFYGCTNDKGCNSFEFYSWYKKEPYFSTDMANEWNLQKRFLKIAIDKDGDVSEYLYVSALGGMTYEISRTISNGIARWTRHSASSWTRSV